MSQTHIRTALVTGSTSGIGQAIAETLADAGLRVLVSGRNLARGEAVVAQIKSRGGQADFVRASLHDASSAATLANDALQAAGGQIDVLVNNAASWAFAPTTETTEAAFDETFDLDVKVPFFLTAALVPGMLERRDGVIVNITTMVASFGMPGAAVYGSAKAALTLLTKAWAAEFSPRGVRVNAVSPGPTATETALQMGAALDALVAGSPSGRATTPVEVAAAVAYLVSPAAANTTGVVLPVDGGRLAV